MSIAFHKRANRKYVQYTIRIEESILEDMRALAVKEGISINESFNQALKYVLQEYKNENKL